MNLKSEGCEIEECANNIFVHKAIITLKQVVAIDPSLEDAWSYLDTLEY